MGKNYAPPPPIFFFLANWNKADLLEWKGKKYYPVNNGVLLLFWQFWELVPSLYTSFFLIPNLSPQPPLSGPLLEFSPSPLLCLSPFQLSGPFQRLCTVSICFVLVYVIAGTCNNHNFYCIVDNTAARGTE